MWQLRAEEAAHREAFIRTELHKVADDYFEEGVRSYKYAMVKTPERATKELAIRTAWRRRADMSFGPATRLYKIELAMNPDNVSLAERLADIEYRSETLLNVFDRPK